MAEFSDIYYIPEDKVFCYRTGKNVYEEQLIDGRLCAMGYNAAGYTQNVLDWYPSRLNMNFFPEPEAFQLKTDAYTLNNDWEFVDFQTERVENANKISVLYGHLTLKNTMKNIRVVVHTALDGTAVFRRWLTIANDGEVPSAIGHVAPLSGGLENIWRWHEYIPGENSDALYEIGAMRYDTPCKEGAFHWTKLPEAVYSVAGRWQFDRYRHPMFILRNNAIGTVFTAQLGWTGGYSFDFTLSAANDMASLSCRVRLDGPNPYIVLDAGEEIDTPEVHMAAMFGSVDDAVNEMHDHIRKSVFLLPEPRGMKGGWVEVGMGAERLMDVQSTKHFADTAAMIGAETVIIDAGWYAPLGTENRWGVHVGEWYPGENRYPNGIEEIRDYIHGKGMLFGLWLDLERISRDSYLVKEHPEWMLKKFNGDMLEVVDMTNPEAAAWVESELERVLSEYQVDLFRLDFNCACLEPAYYVRHKGERESGCARYYKAVYAMYERVRRHFPDVVFENCAGGGGRTDLGLMSSFTHTWVSDWQVAPRSAVITNGMTMALPPERVDRLVSGMSSHTRASLDFMVRHTLFGRPSSNDYNAIGSKMNPCQIEFVRHSFDIFKNFIRPFAPNGKIYHHTPEKFGTHPSGDLILERSAAERDRSVIGIFRLAGKVQQEDIVVYPRGIDMGRTYEIISDNRGETAVRDGFSLLNDGIRVRLPGTLTSELILLKAID